MNNFSMKVRGKFMLMVMAVFIALLAKAYNYNTSKHLDEALDAIEGFQKAFNEELDMLIK